MKYAGYDKYVLEDGEPESRLCSLCLPDLDREQIPTRLYLCPLCGNFYIHGKLVHKMSREQFAAFARTRLEHVEIEQKERTKR